MTAPISATLWPDLTNPHGRRFSTTWGKLCARLSVPRVSDDKRGPGLSLATFAGDRRALANVETVGALGLDFDEALDWDVLVARFAGCASFVHTTWSSTEEEPRARAFLLLSRPVTGDEYRRCYTQIAKHCEDGGLVLDRAASDPSRLWYLPAVRPDGVFRFAVGHGAPIGVDGVLAAAPPPVPPPPPLPTRPDAAGASAVTRARAYLAQCPGAISGSGGHTTTFLIAQRLVRGFLLTESEAFSLLVNDWNPRCEPPWSDRELQRKVQNAARDGRQRAGDMLERERAR